MMDDTEFYTVHDLFGLGKNMYPLIYAIRILNFKDFHFLVVREAYYVGASVTGDNLPTHEVVFLEDGGEILQDHEGDFPYNALPAMAVFDNYDSARDYSREMNEGLLNEYKETHFDFEVQDAKDAVERAYLEEDKTVYKDINRDKKEKSLFSTVYTKTKYPN